MTALTSNGTAVVTLPSDTQILIAREFNAPRHLVYRAWTTPDLVKRWWTGDRGEATVVEIDLRVGGAWRYVLTTDDGRQVVFHGEYREVVPNERIVSTEVYDALPDKQAVNTISFEADGDRTKLTVLVQYAEQADRDTHLSYGMEGGMQEALDKLEQLAVSLG